MAIRIGVLGATGYTGYEVVKLLENRSDVDLVWLSSENNPGINFAEHFADLYQKIFVSTEQALSGQAGAVDFCFVCLPHTLAMKQVPKLLQQGIRVIDLSADFRLKSPVNYRQWYQHEHSAAELLPQAIYGLPEFAREVIKSATLVANPGCYPTSILLPLLPLLSQKLIEPEIIADSKSSVSGAGRAAKTANLFCEVNENFSAYSVGYQHRHIAEIEEQLFFASKIQPQIIFSPHLVPINRGILSTIYVKLKLGSAPTDLHRALQDNYCTEPFVSVMKMGQLPSVKHVANTNSCLIGVSQVSDTQAIIVSVIDNLIKGAAGQAVQNFNIMAGLPEEKGLKR